MDLSQVTGWSDQHSNMVHPQTSDEEKKIKTREARQRPAKQLESCHWVSRMWREHWHREKPGFPSKKDCDPQICSKCGQEDAGLEITQSSPPMKRRSNYRLWGSEQRFCFRLTARGGRQRGKRGSSGRHTRLINDRWCTTSQNTHSLMQSRSACS